MDIDTSRLARLIEIVQSGEIADPPSYEVLSRYRDLSTRPSISGEIIQIIRLAELMRADPALSRLDEARLAYGQGVTTLPLHRFAEWLWLLFRQHRSPLLAARALERLCRENDVQVTMFMFIAGIEVKNEVALTTEVTLSPIGALSREVQKAMDDLPHAELSVPISAALSMQWRLPAVLHIGEGADGPENQSIWNEQMERLHEVRRCLTLIGPSCPTFYGAFTAIDQREGPVRSSRLFSSTRLFLGYEPGAFDEDRARAVISRFIALDRTIKDELYVCLERLNQAVRKLVPVDKAIDLGIALEAMLVQEEATEISYRLALRGAALFSEDPAERLKARNLLKAIYTLRSQAVHRGRLEPKIKVHPEAPKWENRQVLEEGIKLAAGLAEKLINRGGTIPWDHLLLGHQQATTES